MRANCIKAFTIIEILVVMVITSVLILIIMEGIVLMKSYSTIITSRMSDNQILFEGHRQIERLVEVADSAASSYDVLLMHKDGEIFAKIFKEYNLLIVEYTDTRDTVFKTVVDMNKRKDSLYVELQDVKSDNIVIGFDISPKKFLLRHKKIEMNELRYSHK